MAKIIETDWGLMNLDTFCYALWKHHDGKIVVDFRFVGENGFVKTFPTLDEAKVYLEEFKAKIEGKTKKKKNRKELLIEKALKSLEKDVDFPIIEARAYELAKDFYEYRNTIKKPIKTEIPIKQYLKNLIEIKLTTSWEIDEAIELMKSREWQTIKAEWLQNFEGSSSGGLM